MYILSTQSILKIVKREKYLHPLYIQYSEHCCKRETRHLIVKICRTFIIFNSLYCKILHSNFFSISNYSKLLWMWISLLLNLDGHGWLTLFWWEGLRQSGVWRSCSGSLNYTRVSGDGTVWFLTAGVGKVIDHTANIWEIGVHWTSVVQQKTKCDAYYVQYFTKCIQKIISLKKKPSSGYIILIIHMIILKFSLHDWISLQGKQINLFNHQVYTYM